MTSKKQAVIEKINEAMIKEELAIPLYVSHIQQSLFWSGLSKKKQETIIIGLKTLAAESKMHVTYLNKVLDIYKKSK
ncbi:MAG: hypothetical protein ACOYL8_01140 [Patescibacteria group bacterium]